MPGSPSRASRRLPRLDQHDPGPEREALLDGGRDDWGAEDYRAIWESSEGAQPLDRLLDLNLRTYLLDDLLVKTDRMSMAHGLEVRCPFLDTELLDFAARLPPAFKARGLSLKRVLKAAVEDLLPRQILRRGKRGFGVPLIAGFARTCAATWPPRWAPATRG